MIKFKVSEIIEYVKSLFTKDFILTKVKIEGEISNFKIHNNGNIYFSLKDDNTKISSIIFKWNVNENSTTLRDGDYVLCSGAVNLGRDGTLSYSIEQVEKYGVGKIYEQFLELKNELEIAGYFDEKNKKSLPNFPKKVGIITSPTGAAIRDIITVIQRRNRYTDILLYPALVQGNESAKSLIEALDYMENTDVDLVIIGRGGGSYEDLNSFNSKELALRIFNFNKPIISAVGHEVDFVISDFIADKRAATPSVAAEIAVPNLEDFIYSIEQKINRLTPLINEKVKIKELELSRNKLRLKNVSIDDVIDRIKDTNLARLRDNKHRIDSLIDLKLRELGKLKNNLHRDRFITTIDSKLKEIDNIKQNANNIVRVRLDKESEKLHKLNNIIITLNINKMLEEGYAIVSSMDNKVVTKVTNVKVGDKLKILLSDGELAVEVLGREL